MLSIDEQPGSLERSAAALARLRGGKPGPAAPLLIQTPPGLGVDVAKLDALIANVGRAFRDAGIEGTRVALDARGPGWTTSSAVRERLAKAKGWTLVTGMHPQYRSLDYSGADAFGDDFAYWRMHGPHMPLHGTSYDTEQLERYAVRIHAMRQRGKDVYVAFLNEDPLNNAFVLQNMARKLAGEKERKLPPVGGKGVQQLGSFFKPAGKLSSSKPKKKAAATPVKTIVLDD